MTFREFIKFKEAGGLWFGIDGPQDNPSNPGTKRRNARNLVLYNKRYEGQPAAGAAAPLVGAPMAGTSRMKK